MVLPPREDSLFPQAPFHLQRAQGLTDSSRLPPAGMRQLPWGPSFSILLLIVLCMVQSFPV